MVTLGKNSRVKGWRAPGFPSARGSPSRGHGAKAALRTCCARGRLTGAVNSMHLPVSAGACWHVLLGGRCKPCWSSCPEDAEALAGRCGSGLVFACPVLSSHGGVRLVTAGWCSPALPRSILLGRVSCC